MTVVRPHSSTVAVANTPSSPGVPTWLAGLVAVHPAIADHYKKDPGLRAFLDANRANLVDNGLPPGAVKDSVTWETWCHATSNVPVAERDQEYVVVVARGSAYKNQNEVQFPLQNGKTGSSDGRIVFIAKTSDLLHTQKDADEGGHYKGAITVDVTIPIGGAAGEKVSLAYCRIRPDAKGAVHPHHSGWPDSFSGVMGGYSGRELEMKVSGGRRQFVESVDGCSTTSSAKLLP